MLNLNINLDRYTVVFYSRPQSQITNFLFKNSWMILDVFFTIFCLIGDQLLNSGLGMYVLVIYFIARILFSTIDQNFSILVFLIPNLGIMHFTASTVSIPSLNILICISLVKLVIKCRNMDISKWYLFFIIFIIFYEALHLFSYNLKSIFLLFSWIGAVLYAALYLIYSRNTYNHLNTIKYFLVGLVISILYGIVEFYQLYGSILNQNATIRFRGGAGDSNYFSMYIMVAMFSMLHLVIRGKSIGKNIFYPLLFVFFAGFGILSLSRMFILVVTITLMFLLLKLLLSLRRSKKLIHFIVMIIILTTILSFFYHEEILSLLDLLFSRFTNYINDPDALTSNRNIIAESYFTLMNSDWKLMVFGMGIQDYHIRSGVYLETHNILIELFVVWGLLGFIIFFLFIMVLTVFASSKKLRRTAFISWLPVLAMGISYLSINALSNESFYLLLLFAIKNIYEYE
ncbi:O-antigen ligase family protein [Psychrobacillus sp. FSL K6-2684]|uniref:O-antigen ligase family protein n=1 Tax=unclassified Psychrobacillus TaxID=2636677 RepID=UPI001248EBA8|nr:O-antigen ligase family protein [Psychrobacillus sp. AK 1817]QEY22497.1 hypothetical protein D0S48_18550 [Psychrobacillus sp. AK 1817]